MASDNVDRAGRDARTSNFSEKLFEDQLLPHVNRLQQYRQSSSENKSTACSLQEEALRAIYRIYSLRLRPANLTETSSETLLQNQLLELMNQPYRIDEDSGDPSTIVTTESPDSPLWALHDWSLKLTRFLIDNGYLSAGTMKIVENHLTKLLETIQECQLKAQTCPRISTNSSIMAHCLCRIFKINRSTESTRRRLLEPSFIQNHLFPLACKFVATEYPASILDPISYYELFESSGKLVEPDEALVEWKRRNEEKGNSGNSGNRSKRIRLEDGCRDLEGDDADSLPLAHVCLEHLIYKLTVSSNQTNQDVIVKFLQRKASDTRDEPICKNIDRSMTGADDEACKFALMSKIVALHVLGRVRLQPISCEEISFMSLLVLHKFEHNCLLLKICKFQLVRFLRLDDIWQRVQFTRAFFSEFFTILEIEDYRDECNKLFVIFTSVASECLHKLWNFGRLESLFNTYVTSLDCELKLDLIKRIIALYLDYKIVAPLVLVKIMQEENKSEDFKRDCEHLMAKAIDSIAAELLVISPTSDRAQNLSVHLYEATALRKLLLPSTTLDRFMKYTITVMMDDDHILHETQYLNAETYFEFAIRNPPQGEIKFLAIDMVDRYLKDPFTDSSDETIYTTMILGNLCYHQVTCFSLASISSNSAISASDMHDQFGNRNPLFESHERLRDILALCNRIGWRTDLTSSWVMSILMSWPSLQGAAVIAPPSAVSSIKSMWHCFVDSAIKICDKFNLQKTLFIPLNRITYAEVDEYNTCVNLLFSLITAFNQEPKQLENYLNYVKGPAGRSQSHTLKYVELWLDVVITSGDEFMDRKEPDKTFADRSYVVISYQTLINIHQTQTADKLGFSIKELTSKLNSACQVVLKCLAYYRLQATSHESPLENFYAHSIRQLEAIGSFG